MSFNLLSQFITPAYSSLLSLPSIHLPSFSIISSTQKTTQNIFPFPNTNATFKRLCFFRKKNIFIIIIPSYLIPIIHLAPHSPYEYHSPKQSPARQCYFHFTKNHHTPHLRIHSPSQSATITLSLLLLSRQSNN